MKWHLETRDIADLKPYDKNPRKFSKLELAKLRQSMKRFDVASPLVINTDGTIIGGHARYQILLSDGVKKVPCMVPDRQLSEKEVQELNIRLNRNIAGDWDWDILQAHFDVGDLFKWGFEENELQFNIPTLEVHQDQTKRSLAEDFIIPPVTIFDTRQGYWRDRRKAWMSLGIQGEAGRGNDLTYKNSLNTQVGRMLSKLPGISVLDPVLCEVVYKWFCPPQGTILNPFAGESVPGIVAAVSGYRYTGIDLRAEQVDANTKQAQVIASRTQTIHPDNMPVWITGDSRDMDQLLDTGATFDFVFSCPPYFDLEQYSDDERDLSNAGGYDEFLDAYREIIGLAIKRLRDNRFACFVVANIRDKKGMYHDFVGDTIRAFEDAGAAFYNDIVLVNVIGGMRLRVRRQFTTTRKIGRVHQNVLVFVKGDPKKATQAVGDVKVGDIKEADAVEA